MNKPITDAKIVWLVERGYVVEKMNDGEPAYYVTPKGKQYLNSKE